MARSVFNIPRVAAKEWGNSDPTLKDQCIWISISEPNEQRTIVSNKYLDQLPKLKLPIWDLTEAVRWKEETLMPPSEGDARKLVNFLVKYQDKSVIVNCAAGISRSGAIAQFCHDFLGHEWPEFYRQVALPNSTLYRLMVDYYTKNYLTKEDF